MSKGVKSEREHHTCELKKKLYGPTATWLHGTMFGDPPTDQGQAGYLHPMTAALLSPPAFMITPM